jgi:membrane associated rhomboid family serine protease
MPMPEYAPLEAILRRCAEAAPVPWYPKAAADLGLREEDLAALVELLRGGGLIARTDAMPGHGRGYVLTPLGVQALRDPGDLQWLRAGQVPPPREPAAGTAAGEGAPAVSQRERAVRMSLLAPYTAYVAYGLIAVNVIVFLWAIHLGQRRGMKWQDFIYQTPRDIAHATGAVSADDVLTPGWGYVRLLTCCFVHFGLVHLGANMFSLYLVGPLLERMWGHVRFLVLYLIAGFGGSCAAMVLRPVGPTGLPVTLAGASGALWGVLASMAVWVVVNRRYMPRRLLSSWATQIVIVFIINIALTYQMSGLLSAEAHYGGGIVGAVCALLLHFTRFGPLAVRAVATAAVAMLPVLGVWAVAHPARFNTEWERLEMNQRYLPAVGRAEQRTKEILQHSRADMLLNQNPTRRDQEAVNDAVAKYDEASQALRPAADVLREAGPYRNPDIENARRVGLELIEAQLELWALQERSLREGQPWPGNDKKNREQLDRVDELDREWTKARQLR